MPNPFVEAGMIPGPHAAPSETIQERVNESFFEAAATEEKARQQQFHWRTRNKFAQDMSAVGFEFIKRAIHLAAAKFVLELCAMVIDAIMRALSKHGTHNKAMDITSPNVVYAANGQTPQNQSTSSWLNRAASATSEGLRTARSESFSASPSAVGW